MKSETNNTKNIAIMILAIIAVGTASFFGGMMFAKKSQAGRTGQLVANANGRFGGGAQRGGRGFGGAVIGEIITSDADSITVKLMDGSSKIVNLSKSTTYSKATIGSKSDLATGTKVAVFGSQNSDGSVTAQNVSINPMTRMGSGTNQGGRGVKPSTAPGY